MRTGIERGSTCSQPSSVAPARLESVYPSMRASAARMRHALGDYLTSQAVSGTVIHDVVLAADEAFINAVGHAGAANGPISVTARVSDGEAAVEIRDGGHGFVSPRADPTSAPGLLCAHGRGIFLMQRLMDEVSVSSGRTGTTVRMVRRLD